MLTADTIINTAYVIMNSRFTTTVVTPFFWLGFTLALISIFGLQPLNAKKIEFLRNFDDILL